MAKWANTQGIVGVGAALLLLAACGGAADETNNTAPESPPQNVVTPTPAATLTFEERITYPAGQVENPIVMVIRPVDTVAERIAFILEDDFDAPPTRITPDATLASLNIEDVTALSVALQRDFDVTIAAADVETLITVDDVVEYVQNRLGQQVSQAILARSSLYVDVVLVERSADALEALCGSSGGIAAIAWLDSLTYAAASARNCGQAALQVARAEDGLPLFGVNDDASAEATPEAEATAEPQTIAYDPRDLRTGAAGVVIASDAFAANSSLSFISGQVFCRTGLSDFYSWFVPALLMEQTGLDPLRVPAAIMDYGTTDDLVAAVASGECAAAGVSDDVLSRVASDAGVNVITRTPPLPYAVLMYPLEVQLGVRLSLSQQLMALSQDEAASRPLRLLLGQDVFVPADNEQLSQLQAFLNASGYDFAVLGN